MFSHDIATDHIWVKYFECWTFLPVVKDEINNHSKNKATKTNKKRKQSSHRTEHDR